MPQDFECQVFTDGCDFRTKGDLKRANFNSVKVLDAIFIGTDLTGADFTGASLIGAKFQGCNLEQANFTRANLKGADFTNAFAKINESNKNEEKLQIGFFDYANLMEANFTDAKLSGFKFRRANLQKVDFTRTVLKDADLGAAECIGAIFSETNIEKARLRGANFMGVKFISVKASGSNFRGAKLEKAQFLGESDFCRAKLTRVNLKEAVITCHKFQGVDLKGAHLYGIQILGSESSKVNLSGADFRGSTSFEDPDENPRAIYQHVNMSYLKGQRADFTCTEFRDVLFLDAILENAIFSRARLNNCNMQNLKATLVNFKGSYINNCHFNLSELQNASFASSEIQKCFFNGASMQGVSFHRSTIKNSYFDEDCSPDESTTKSSLNGSYFKGSTIENTSIQRSSLRKVDFKRSILRHVDFTDSNLSNSRFKFARLENVTFRMAQELKDSTNFNGTDLTCAILERVKLQGLVLKKAKIDSATLLECQLEYSEFGKMKLLFTDIRRSVFSENTLNQLQFIYPELSAEQTSIRERCRIISNPNNIEFNELQKYLEEGVEALEEAIKRTQLVCQGFEDKDSRASGTALEGIRRTQIIRRLQQTIESERVFLKMLNNHIDATIDNTESTKNVKEIAEKVKSLNEKCFYAHNLYDGDTLPAASVDSDIDISGM